MCNGSVLIIAVIEGKYGKERERIERKNALTIELGISRISKPP
jgi:hypothetical protein